MTLSLRPAGLTAPASLLLALAGLPPAQAGTFDLGGGQLSYGGAVTLGQSRRASDRNPDVLNRLNAATVGTPGTATGGRNQDDGNLNFEDGDAFSSVLKAYGQARWRRGGYALQLSAKAWYDHTLEQSLPRWGNLANGLRSDRPLSDAGFDRRSRFSGAVLQEAYAEAEHGLGSATVNLRLGQQWLGWGEASLLGGGVRMVDAIDTPAARRPGSVAGENQVPALALRARLHWASGFRLDAFVLGRFEPNASTVCGTFHSVADYLDGGCDKTMLGAAANDRDNLAAGSYLRRSGVVKPSNGGQYGLSLGWGTPQGPWRAALYAANLHHRALLYNMIKTRRTAGAPALPNDPGGLNPMYEIEYAEDLRLFAIDASVRLAGGVLSAEWSHAPNLPVPLNAGDLVGAFTAVPSTPALLRADERATPPGGRFRGYDRLSVSDLRLGYGRSFAGLAGAELLQLRAQVAGKFVHDLPDVSVRRYRRPDVYGNGPVNGACTGAPDSKQCSTEGYVTASAWGIRLRVAGQWRVGPGWLLQPSFTFGQDLRGWSFDNVLGEGRRTLLAAVRLSSGGAAVGAAAGSAAGAGEGGRAGGGAALYGELSASRVWGNPFDNAADRDAVSVVLGWQF